MQAESDWTDEPSRSSKRRRTDAERLARPRKYHLEGKYCDRYRLLFNGIVQQAANRFDSRHMPYAFYSWQIGSSLWSTAEQATFYSALQRLGRDNVPGIADAVGKSIPEVRELLLLLHGAAVKQGDAGLTFRDIPAAVEIGDECDAQVELAADALAWYQEKWEARQEQKQYGDYWLITSAVAVAIENAIDGEVDEPAPPRRGGKVIVGYVCMFVFKKTILTCAEHACHARSLSKSATESFHAVTVGDGKWPNACILNHLPGLINLSILKSPNKTGSQIDQIMHQLHPLF